MLGFVSRPTGGLGNRLFQYHFLLQFARLANGETSIPWKKDHQFVSKTTGLLAHWVWASSQKLQTLSSSDFQSYSQNEIKNFMLEKSSSQEDIALKPPILGELFYQTCFEDPKTLFKPQKVVAPPNPYIAIHIRGGDFASWNPAAILPSSYYRDAIELTMQSRTDFDTPLVIVTDDLAQPSVAEIARIFSENLSQGLEIRQIMRSDSDLSTDFRLLGSAETLISSPSTFAIWASILGQNREVLHSKIWVERMANEGDQFWASLLAGGNGYYRAERLV